MRQQYHSRPSGGDILIWDVNRLAGRAKDMPVIELALSAVQELDEPFWYNDINGYRPTCRSVADHAKLIEETELKYPILICDQGRVVDGMHRVCKAYMQGLAMIRAVRFDPMPPPDYKNVPLKDLPYDD